MKYRVEVSEKIAYIFVDGVDTPVIKQPFDPKTSVYWASDSEAEAWANSYVEELKAEAAASAAESAQEAATEKGTVTTEEVSAE